jgi:hypothetical protein
MSAANDLTGDAFRWRHLEACYQLALTAAKGFAPPQSVDAAFTAARWGLHMGMAIARLDPDLAEAIHAELEDYDLIRDGLEAATHARYMMFHDVQELRRAVERAEGTP